MTYYTLAVKQKFTDSTGSVIIEGFIDAETGDMTDCENATPFGSWKHAAAALESDDYENCVLLSATIERHEVED